MNWSIETILEHILELGEEDSELERHHADVVLTPERNQGFASIEAEFDQRWDLLRQRQARRSAGLKARNATVKPEEVMERYFRQKP